MNGEKVMIQVSDYSRGSAIGIAAQLRLIAELLENGQMTIKLGGIMVNSNFSGEVTVESDLVLQCHEQPTVDDTTEEVEEIVLCDPICEAVYQFLDHLDPGQKKLTTFDHDDADQWDQWIKAIHNRVGYPKYLTGRMFEVKPYRNLNELGFWTVRLV